MNPLFFTIIFFLFFIQSCTQGDLPSKTIIFHDEAGVTHYIRERSDPKYADRWLVKDSDTIEISYFFQKGSLMVHNCDLLRFEGESKIEIWDTILDGKTASEERIWMYKEWVNFERSNFFIFNQQIDSIIIHPYFFIEHYDSIAVKNEDLQYSKWSISENNNRIAVSAKLFDVFGFIPIYVFRESRFDKKEGTLFAGEYFEITKDRLDFSIHEYFERELGVANREFDSILENRHLFFEEFNIQ